MTIHSKKTETDSPPEEAAMLSYLDSLLREATEIPLESASPTETMAEYSELHALQPTLPVVSVESLATLELTADEVSPVETPNSSENLWIDGRPAWARKRFEVLLFEMHGVKFAAPLIELGLIHNLDKELNKLAGHPDWVAGILPLQGKSTLVVDTLKALMPDKAEQSEAVDFKYVITINNSHWGLACSKLIKTLTMEPDQVKWRTVRSSRTWLVGTVLDQMCSMVDVKVLAQGFDQKTKAN
ncbi:MAG TPA: chemotaxis protein CheW [Pseudomonadales bacterium]|nr:chemotaxis protein CheW [Pseudomonadales bacterium]